MAPIGNLTDIKHDEKSEISGTHNGKLDVEARKRRSVKNARNAYRSGEATRSQGSQSKGRATGKPRRGN